MYLIYHVASHDHLIEMANCEFMGWSSSFYVITLLVMVEICF